MEVPQAGTSTNTTTTATEFAQYGLVNLSWSEEQQNAHAIGLVVLFLLLLTLLVSVLFRQLRFQHRCFKLLPNATKLPTTFLYINWLLFIAISVGLCECVALALAGGNNKTIMGTTVTQGFADVARMLMGLSNSLALGCLFSVDALVLRLAAATLDLEVCRFQYVFEQACKAVWVVVLCVGCIADASPSPARILTYRILFLSALVVILVPFIFLRFFTKLGQSTCNPLQGEQFLLVRSCCRRRICYCAATFVACMFTVMSMLIHDRHSPLNAAASNAVVWLCPLAKAVLLLAVIGGLFPFTPAGFVQCSQSKSIFAPLGLHKSVSSKKQSPNSKQLQRESPKTVEAVVLFPVDPAQVVV